MTPWKELQITGVWWNKRQVPVMPYTFSRHGSTMASAAGTRNVQFSSQVLLPALRKPHLGLESRTGARNVPSLWTAVNDRKCPWCLHTHTHSYAHQCLLFWVSRHDSVIILKEREEIIHTNIQHKLQVCTPASLSFDCCGKEALFSFQYLWIQMLCIVTAWQLS